MFSNKFYFNTNFGRGRYRAISGKTDCPWDGTDHETDISLTSGSGNIMTLGQSVYPDIALHINNYYISIELLSIISSSSSLGIQYSFKTLILGINKTLHTDK
jgi:hypothetical protein